MPESTGDELTDEALLRAEAVAADDHHVPHHRGPHDESLARAAELLRARCASLDGADTHGQLACAQLLEEIDRERRLGGHLGEGLAVVATRVARQLLDLAAAAGPAVPAPRAVALTHCRVRARPSA